MADITTDAKALRVSPLEVIGHRMVATSSPRVTINEIPFETQIGLRGDASKAAFNRAVKSALGVAPPKEACTAVEAGDRRILWLGPDEWLAVAPDDTGADLLGKLEGPVAKAGGAAIDLTANRTVIVVSGPDARGVLEKGCLHDLHPRAFPTGRVVGTLLAKSQIFLEKTGDKPETFRLYVRASFARHLAEWLIDAAAEFAA